MPDPHGNVAGQAQAAALTTALRYDGYGQTIASAPASLPAQARRWKYQGRLDIAPDGLAAPLYDFSARFYSPGLGSFTQLDPMQGSALDPLTLNRYLYAAANPATLIDPTGHFTMEKDDAPGSHCKNRGDTGCGETAIANPGAAGGWQSSTGAVYSTYTGNTNSNNSPSTSVVNQTAGGSDPPPAFPGLASEYPGYDLAHNTVIDCRISNGGNFVSTLQCAQNLLGESWGRWAFKEFVGKGDRQFMESDLDEAERKCLSGITGFCATYQALLPFYQDDTQNPLAAAIGAAFVYRYFLRASVRSDPSRVRAALGEALPLNRRGMTYPQIPDPRTGQPIRFPDGRLAIVDRADRVHWGGVERRDFIKDWIDRGYDVPAGGWSKYDIHHIRPREYGGTNDFDNLVPVLRGEDGHVQFNRFWENW